MHRRTTLSSLLRSSVSSLSIALALVASACGGRSGSLSARTTHGASGSGGTSGAGGSGAIGGTASTSATAGSASAGPECHCPEAPTCFVSFCDDDGACHVEPAVAGLACDDGTVCTVSDRCDGAGACMSGGERTFLQTYGDSTAGAWKALIALPDGSFALAGNTGWHQDTTAYDAWFAITDPQGHVVTEQIWGGDGEEAATAMTRTIDGGFLVAGYASPKDSTAVKVWLARLDAQGHPLWDTTLDTATSVAVQSIVALTDGGFVLGGSTIAGGAYKDAWIGWIDENGTAGSEALIATPRSDAVTVMAPSLDGGFFAAGYARDMANERYDAWLTRHEANGTTSFTTTLEKDQLLSVSDLVSVTQSDVVLLLDVWENNQQISRLRRVSSNGDVLWTLDVVLPGSIDAPSRIVVDADDSLVVVSSQIANAASSYSLIFTRIDPDLGTVRATAPLLYDTTTYPRPYAAVPQLGGTFVLAGEAWIKDSAATSHASLAVLTRVDPWPDEDCGIDDPAWSP